MRFDIVLNNLAGLAWTTRISHDGTRGPLVRPDICSNRLHLAQKSSTRFS
jgi:hypothetical protein